MSCEISRNAALALGELDRDPRFGGETRSDRLSRALYATDASLYEIIPDAVVFPRRVADVAAAVRACAKYGVPLTARGAGTGLAGGAVNRGIQLDVSRHLNRILDVDVANRRVRVEPGVVLDELNAVVGPHGLHFAPDVATSSRATIGGMIANNSCGAHSIVYGRTVDHVLSLDVVLSDGSLVTWGAGGSQRTGRLSAWPAAIGQSQLRPDGALAERCEKSLIEVARDYADEIAARYPKVLRRNGGYALDRLRVENGRPNAETIICGSEGTLGVVVGATLDLTPLPRHRGLVVAHFAELLESLEATPVILEHKPAAVELVDRLVLDAGMQHPAMGRQRSLIDGQPNALLIVEVFDDSFERLGPRLNEVAADLRARGLGYAWPILTDAARTAKVWEIRKSGLGLLMSRPGDEQPYAFVEDTAVDPARLRDYIERFANILREEGVEQAGYYAHASVGCLHVRPVLNLKKCEDVQRMRRIADRISSLALEFGGAMTGEHGDGIVRSCWLEKMYGPRIIEAFRKIKRAFDPQGILNPGKIVDPLPMTEHLRYDALRGARPETENGPTALDFGGHGGMLGLANMCSGVGQCRQRLVGTMCPSYMATGDETHTTRARANALRIALSDHRLLDGLSDPALDEVMDLCLSCKACKTECPTGVDMARLKAEWQWHRHRRVGSPLSAHLIAQVGRLMALGSVVPSLTNAVLQSAPARWLAEKLLGFDRRVPPPVLATETFRRWFERRPRAQESRDRRVAYFVDTWTNCVTPQVGMALVRILEGMGYEVLVPEVVCCGRPAISKGMLDAAERLLGTNCEVLAPYAAAGVPIVVTEPSCFSALVEELPQLVRTAEARRIAAGVVMAESFIARIIGERPDALRWRSGGPPVLYHGHCHQKALVGTADAICLLKIATGGRAEEINSGCCGMAGSFGHEVEHFDVAAAIGEQRLFPAVRNRGEGEVAVSGFSCRHQIEHHTGVRARHLLEIVANLALP